MKRTNRSRMSSSGGDVGGFGALFLPPSSLRLRLAVAVALLSATTMMAAPTRATSTANAGPSAFLVVPSSSSSRRRWRRPWRCCGPPPPPTRSSCGCSVVVRYHSDRCNKGRGYRRHSGTPVADVVAIRGSSTSSSSTALFLSSSPTTTTTTTATTPSSSTTAAVVVGEEVAPPSSSSSSAATTSSSSTGTELTLFALACLLASCVWIFGVENYLGHYAWPNRQQRSNVVVVQLEKEEKALRRLDEYADGSTRAAASSSSAFRFAGQVTVKGMGFGADERELLRLRQEQEEETSASESSLLLSLPERPSYNEIMARHRRERVPRWKQMYRWQQQQATRQETADGDDNLPATTTQDAVHVLCALLKEVSQRLPALAREYRWDDIRRTLPQLVRQLEPAASQLRAAQKATTAAMGSSEYYDDVVGFDWASCAWRSSSSISGSTSGTMCGALADAQEALDELDARLGLLEPFEVVFVLDVVERSLRDMLAPVFAVPHDPHSQSLLLLQPRDEDWRFWRDELPEYRPLPSAAQGGGKFSTSSTADDADGGDGAQQQQSFDDEYLRAIQDLRVDDF